MASDVEVIEEVVKVERWENRGQFVINDQQHYSTAAA